MPTSHQINRAVRALCRVAKQYGIADAFFVGGYPRTIAMGRPLTDVHDLDVATATPEKATQLAGFVASEEGVTKIKTHHRMPTVTMSLHGVEVDFQAPGSHDDARAFMRSIGVDPTPLSMNIFDRDFTMNSLAIPFGRNEIMDLTGRGVSDIRHRIVSSILPPAFSVPSDPLMITRAVRFSVKFGFAIEKSLWQAMKDHRMSVKKLSPERQAVEAYVLSKYPQSKKTLTLLGLQDLLDDEIIKKGEEESEDG